MCRRAATASPGHCSVPGRPRPRAARPPLLGVGRNQCHFCPLVVFFPLLRGPFVAQDKRSFERNSWGAERCGAGWAQAGAGWREAATPAWECG